MTTRPLLHQLVKSAQSLLQIGPSAARIEHARQLAQEIWLTDEAVEALGDLYPRLLGANFRDRYSNDEHIDLVSWSPSEKNPFTLLVTFKGIHVAVMTVDASGNKLRYVYSSNEFLN